MFKYWFSRMADVSGFIAYDVLKWQWLQRLDERFWTAFPDRWFDQSTGPADAKPCMVVKGINALRGWTVAETETD